MKDLTEILNKISETETKLTELLGGDIWGYANILDEKRKSYALTIASLNEQQKIALSNYIAAVNNLLLNLDLSEVTISTDNAYSELDNYTTAFVEASSIVFSLRYAWALKEFASYQLIRVKTWLETELLKKGGFENHPDTDITIAIPLTEAILTSENGDIDLQKTANAEAQSHLIKTFLSISTHVKVIKHKLFQDMLDYSSFGMIPRLFEDEIQTMAEGLAKALIADPTNMVYNYLARGYTLSESIQNVNKYYENVIQSQAGKLAPTFSDLETILKEVITSILDVIPNIKAETKVIYTAETINQSIAILMSKQVFPMNFYQLTFRKANPNFASEKFYNYAVDSFVYNGNRIINEYPIETYAIELTEEAKEQIFESVTNGNINPKYTLKDYLRFQPIEIKST